MSLSPHQLAKLPPMERVKYQQNLMRTQQQEKTLTPKPKELEEEPAAAPKTTAVPASDSAQEKRRTKAKTITLEDPNRYQASFDMNYADINIKEPTRDRVKELITVLTPIGVDDRTKPGDNRKFKISHDQNTNYFSIEQKSDSSHRVSFKDLSQNPDEIKLSFTTYEDSKMNPQPDARRSFLEKLFLEKEITISEDKNPNAFAKIQEMLTEASKEESRLLTRVLGS